MYIYTDIYVAIKQRHVYIATDTVNYNYDITYDIIHIIRKSGYKLQSLILII